jgi:proteasome accessory factor B
VSRKSERLVNLVIALLATKRNLTKSEIFRTIEGYEGSRESMERMFERDKDELRSLGIEIEVSGLDPLFEDEVGYRIRPENFAMDAVGYSPAELAYMSVAAQLWKEVSLDETAQRAIRKLSGVVTPVDLSEIPAVAPLVLKAPIFLGEIISCITERKTITFSYLDANMETNVRHINIYSYFSKDGFWYFTGLDVDKEVLRTFRCDRIQGEIVISKKTNSYEIPESFKAETLSDEYESRSKCLLKVRKGRCSQLRFRGSVVIVDDEFDVVNIEYDFEDEILAQILWHLDDVEVLEPQVLRKRTIQSLKRLVGNHG